MGKAYWDRYYKDRETQQPSDFAKFCAECYLKKGSLIVDLGCGDGRDAALLREFGLVVAVDQSNEVKIGNVVGLKMGIQDFITDNWNNFFDVVYVRWVFHSVDEETENLILDFVASNVKVLMAEFRIIGDEPDDTHMRRLIDHSRFLEKLTQRGLTINFSTYGRGFSKVGNDDPYLARIVAERRGCSADR